MNLFLVLVYLFVIGMLIGYVIELFYRHYKDKQRRWFNPGFCIGPWLPIYGFGLCIIFIITFLEDRDFTGNELLDKLILFFIMSICMTLIELIAGIIMDKFFNCKLWDYSKEKFNFKGYICPKYSFYWMLLAAIYYFLVHHRVYNGLIWLSNNLWYSFFLGLIMGIFIIDVIYSGRIVDKIRRYAIENGVTYKIDEIKDTIRRNQAMHDAKIAFFFTMKKENFEKYNIFD